METIQLQCGQCKNVMAISIAHLGQQVQCPHCRAVVQTPAPAAETVALPGTPSRPPAEDPTFGLPNEPVVEREPPAPEAQTEFTQFKPKARRDYSVLLIMALIFLVPYALTMTFFVIWLVYTRATAPDGLEYLRDPAPSPNKGGARPAARGKRPSHELDVAAHRKTTLGKKVRAGDIEVNPLHVILTKEGDLKLVLRVRNVGERVAFEPMSLIFVDEHKAVDRPYTFLESRSKRLDNVYGGDLAYHKNRDAKDAPQGFAVLAPRDEVTLTIITHERYQKKQIADIAKSTSDEFTWRVQLRRGFQKVDGKDVSVTTVFGIDFSSKDIEKEGKS